MKNQAPSTPNFLFSPVPSNVTKALVKQLETLPTGWALIPCVEKRPAISGWEKNQPTRQALISGVLNGDRYITKKFFDDEKFLKLFQECNKDVNHKSVRGYTHKRYYSGVGVVGGELSGGLLLIDIDGISAIPLLRGILGLIDDEPLPKTVSWSSGKPGRSQMMFQVSPELRQALNQLPDLMFTRRTPMSFSDLPEAWKEEYQYFENPEEPSQCLLFPVEKGEGLDFRYNRCQSLLPPSVHPTMGFYHWINSPDITDVAPLPMRIEALMYAYINEQKNESIKREEKKRVFASRGSDSSNGGYTPLSTNNLMDAIKEAEQRAGIAGFDWGGHFFQSKEQGWLAGYCPVHGGVSGTSFQVQDAPELNYPWHCHGCAIGGVGINSYRLWRETGQLKFKGHYPVIKKFLDDYGVKVEESEPESHHKDEYLDEIDRQRHKQEEEIEKIKREIRKEEEYIRREKLYFEDRDLSKSGHEFYTEHEQYCSDNLLANMPFSGLIGVQAEMGKGKSRTMRRWLKLIGQDCYFIFVYSRIALGKSQAQILFEGDDNVPWIDDVNVNAFLQGLAGNKIALCYDSLHKIQGFQPNKKIVLVFDEVEAGLSHMLTSDTLKENRGINIKTFVELLNEADKRGVVLVADATLRQKTVQYLKQFMPSSEVKLLINTDKPLHRQATVYTDKKGSFENEAVTKVLAGIPCYIASDSKREAQSVHAQLCKDLGVTEDDTRTLRIDRDTSRTERGLEAILYPDEVIIRDNLMAFIATPSVANGISIECGHFPEAFMYCSATVTPVEAIQQIARDRECTKWLFYAKKGNNALAKMVTEEQVRASVSMTASAAKEMLGEYIKRTREKAGSLKPEDTNYVLIKAQEEMLNDMKAGNIPMMQEEHLWYMVNIIAESNWAKVNFQKVLSAELFRAGHDVSIEKGVDTAMGEQIKERAVEIEIKKAEETSGATARFESYSVAKQAAELSNDPDIRRDGEKSLKAIATGLSDKEITKEFVLLDNKKGWRDELMTRFIFENPEVGIIKDMGVVARKAQNRVKGGIECPLDDKYKANITTYLKMLKVEELISILNLDNMDTEFSVETPGLEEWAKEVDKISPKKKEKIVFFLGSKDHKFPAMSVGTKKKGRNGKTTYQRRYAQMAIWVLEKIGYRFEAKKGKQPSYRLSAEYITQTEEREKLLAGLARKYKVGIESPTETTIEVSQQPEDFDDEFGLMQFLPENQEKFDDEFGLMQFLPENQENSLTLTQ